MRRAPPPLGLSLSRTMSSRRISKTLTLVTKNSRKSRASFNSDPTRQDARFRMFRAMPAKFGSSLLGLIELMDSLSYNMATLVL